MSFIRSEKMKFTALGKCNNCKGTCVYTYIHIFDMGPLDPLSLALRLSWRVSF